MEETTLLGDGPAVLTVPEVAEYLRIGTNTVYELLRRGSIASFRIGRRLLIPRSALLDYVQRAESEERNARNNHRGGPGQVAAHLRPAARRGR